MALNNAINNQLGIANALGNKRLTDLEMRKQKLAETYAPWTLAINGVAGLAGATGGIMQGVGSIQQAQQPNTVVNTAPVTQYQGIGPIPGTREVSYQDGGVVPSDERIKDVMAPAEDLSPIEVWAKGLNPFYYTYKEGSPYDDGGVTHLGVSAQELSQLPGVTSVQEDENGILVVDPAQQVLVNAAVIAELCRAVNMLWQQVQFIMETQAEQLGISKEEAAIAQEQPQATAPQALAEGGRVETEATRPQYSEEARKVLEEIKRRNAQSANSPNLANPSPEPKTDGATSVPTATPQRKKLGGKVSKFGK